MITHVLSVAQALFILQLGSLEAAVFTLRARFQLQLLVGAYSMYHHVEQFVENYEHLDRGRSTPTTDESTAIKFCVSAVQASVHTDPGYSLHAYPRTCQRYAIAAQSKLQLTSDDGP
jgi:hypothetical protein